MHNGGSFSCGEIVPYWASHFKLITSNMLVLEAMIYNIEKWEEL